MKSGLSGSSAFTSWRAIGLWTRPWKSMPASMPVSLHEPQALDRVVETRRAIEPAEILGAVHLDRPEALRLARRGGFRDIGGAIAADPRIDVDAFAHLPAQQLPHRHAEPLALDVPQRLIDAGDSGHQHGAATVEAESVERLPRILDAIGGAADEAILRAFHRAGHRFGMAFEARFAPADQAIVGLDADEQPARRDEEGFDPGNEAHETSWSCWAPAAP